ncbi:NUDIX domain-containing protein [Thalassobaculum sp.]|uniref:NUDIX domain-containing protein n=1 Tax=Thalassobaculum sp. TaxID=2022740 RepID=UPI003B5AC103
MKVSDLPEDFPVVERKAVRLIVRDIEGSVLLLHARDVTDPELGHWRELPGGGIDAGETPSDAALRELREETWSPTGATTPRPSST